MKEPRHVSGTCSLAHVLRQSRLHEVLLQLLMDQLKLSECHLTLQKAIINSYFEVIHLPSKREVPMSDVLKNLISLLKSLWKKERQSIPHYNI